MLRKFSLCALLLVFCASLNLAQTTDDYNKFEVAAGYSNNQVDTGANSQGGNAAQNFFNDRESFHGFQVSGVGNFHRYVGVKGDFSAHFKDYNLTTPSVGTTIPARNFEVNGQVYNFLAGVQVKDNAKGGSRLRPFGHAMIGAVHAKAEIEQSFFTSPFCAQAGVNCSANIGDDSETGFAAAIGGGLDVRATDRFSIRAFQVDYNPNRVNGSTSHNFRFGVGLVFH